MDVFQIIQESAHLFQNPNDSLGYGIPNFYLGFLNTLDHHSNNLKIYPNPYDDHFVIDHDFKDESCIKIYNSIGKIIWSQIIKKNCTKVDVDQLSYIPQGIYFLTINNSTLHPIIKK